APAVPFDTRRPLVVRDDHRGASETSRATEREVLHEARDAVARSPGVGGRRDDQRPLHAPPQSLRGSSARPRPSGPRLRSCYPTGSHGYVAPHGRLGYCAAPALARVWRIDNYFLGSDISPIMCTWV